MEEISSLDSFQTDEANSSARPESETTQQSGKEGGQHGNVADSTAKDKDTSAVEGGGTANEDDFDQISEGTFEVDENSRATSAGQQHDENTAGGGDDGGSQGFEQFDANVATHTGTHDESDMLGEADNTLPLQREDEDNPMEVDQIEGNDKNGNENDNDQDQDDFMETLQQDDDDEKTEKLKDTANGKKKDAEGNDAEDDGVFNKKICSYKY